ncbi:MAG: multicopper oxidase domain-containing protein [Pseudomonadota bacterium]
MSKPSRLPLSCVAVCQILLMPVAFADDVPERSATIASPPPAGVSFASYGAPSELMEGRAALQRLEAGTVEWTARVAYTEAEIYNPSTDRMDTVRLRSYQGAGVDPDVSFVPPTINLRPGDTFRLNLINDLPADDPSCPGSDNINLPHCFNITNMHTHGVWVSPAGNSDNVLLSIPPGGEFTYEYNIPSDHPAGTFWYHPHMHGSTALQVSSGMTGALIIRGERLPTPTRAGDIDTLLRDRAGDPLAEHVILTTQIAYACGPISDNGEVQIKKDEDGAWICDEGDTGAIEGYNQFGLEEPEIDAGGMPIVKTRWVDSGRHTALNGRVIPTYRGVKAGEFERWRFIHAGVSGSIGVSFHRYTPPESGNAYQAGDPDARSRYVDGNCTGPAVTQFSIALDGLTRSEVHEQVRMNMHPGYRDDVLMAFPEPGVYCIIDNDAPAHETIRMQARKRQLLGFVVVEGRPVRGEQNLRKRVQDLLVTAARRHMPPNVRQRIVDDLSGERIDLTAFEPHESLLAEELDGTQTLGFDVDLDTEPHSFVVGNLQLNDGELPTIDNPDDYVAGRIDRELTLEHTEQWIMASFKEGHPFHIHVNPFQIVSIIDPDSGADVSAPGSGSVYAGLKGQWKDTVFVPTNLFGEPFVVTVRTRYRRYIGTFVLHCHILDHEDFGMMQALTISMPSPKHSGAHH